MTIAVIGTLRFPPDEVASLLPHLKALVEATHAHDGCIAYDVGEDPFDPGLFRFSELWPDQDALTRHGQAPHIAPWRAACQANGIMERKLMVYDVSNERPL